MPKDSRLSRTLHTLIHMADQEEPLTSDVLAKSLKTHGPAIRRMMSGLKASGIVSSSKGHGGGWMLERELDQITLLQIYEALGEPTLFAIGPAQDTPDCLVEQAVDAHLTAAMDRAAQVLRAELSRTSLADIAAEFEARLVARTKS